MRAKLFKVTFAGLGLALALVGCGSSGDSGTPGTAGTTGSAGTTGAGGTNTAGTTGSAGTTGAGGTSTAGTTGSGGTYTAGTTGSGGSATGTAGSGSAGTTGSGGSASAGTTGTGGSASAGTTGSGGTGRGGSGGSGGSGSGGTTGAGGTSGGTFSLTSPDHADGTKFTMQFTCDMMNGSFGAGLLPELNWDNVPAGTTSFALTFIDTKIGEDMAMGQHWAAWNIPAAARKIPKGTTSFSGDLAGTKQTNKYLAPCPSGNDTYAFTLYALTAPITVSGAEGTNVSNSPGVAKVIAALRAVSPAPPTAKLTGTSGPKGK